MDLISSIKVPIENLTIVTIDLIEKQKLQNTSLY